MHRLRTFLPFLVAALALGACGDVITGPSDSSGRVVRALQLGESNLVIDEGATRTIAVTLLDQQRQPFQSPPEGLVLDWESSDETVATVDAQGVVTGRRTGNARVTATLANVLGRPSVGADIEVRSSAKELVLVSGNGQAGVVGTRLAEPVVVRVTSAAGAGIAGVTVSFIPEELGAPEPITVISDEEGFARLQWTLGTVAGTQTFVATLAGLPDVVVRFAVTAHAGEPHAVAVGRGDGQTGQVQAPLPAPVVARVADQYGNPVSGVTVQFAAPDGHGSAAPAVAATNAEGEASTSWTLGRVAGPMTLAATAEGLVPAQFTATARPGAPARVEVSPDSAAAGALGRNIQFTATVYDAARNVVPEAPLTWVITDTVASVVDQTGLVVTTGNGRSRVRVNVTGTGIWDTAYVNMRQYIDSLWLGRPSSLPVPIGAQDQIFSNTYDSTRHVIERFARREPVTWRSSNTAIATVNASGVVTGVAEGTATIFAAAGTAEASLVVEVGDPVPATLTLVSSATPSAPMDFFVVERIAVQLRDPKGQVMANQRIEWDAPSHAGFLEQEMTTTDANGFARAKWALGETLGRQTLRVSAPDAPGSPSVTVTATATPLPDRIDIVSGNGQYVRAGQRTPEPIVVRVLDQNGDPVANVVPDFSFGTGYRGRIDHVSQITGADGTYAFHMTMTMGDEVIVRTLNARYNRYLGYATPVVIPVNGLDELQGDNQSGMVGTRLAEELAVRVFDDQARPVAGQLVTWSTPHGGTLAPVNGGVSDAQGWARAHWTLGAAEGEQLAYASATISGRQYQVEFSAAATPLQELACDMEGGTVHSGEILQSERWTKAASPHRVSGRLTVRGGKLTIEPGAVVCAQYDSRFQAGELRFEDGAVLDARGTAAEPIRIGSGFGDELRGIEFTGSPLDTSRLSHVHVTNVRWGILAADAHAVVIEDSRVWNTGYHGVRLYAPGSRLVRSVVKDVGRIELADAVTLHSRTSVVDSRIENSGRYGSAVEAEGTGITITGSVLTGNGMALSVLTQEPGPDAHDIVVSGSTIRGGRGAIDVDINGAPRLRISGSSILLMEYGSEDMLVWNPHDLAVEAAGNWWGSASGPEVDRLNGAAVYEPWLTAPPPEPKAPDFTPSALRTGQASRMRR